MSWPFPEREEVARQRAIWIGRRVRCLWCTDEHAPIEYGALGTIELVDDAGTVFVSWDDGRGLGMVPSEDRWEFV